MAATISVRHCIAPESRSFSDIPGIAAVLNRFDAALQEALQTNADRCELPASVIHDCDPHWSNTAINLLGPAVVWQGARTEDGRIHTGSDFVKLIVETAREIKAGSPPKAGNAVAFYGFNLDVIRTSSTLANTVPLQAEAVNALRRSMRP
jgi:hypothetical protein